MNNYKRKPCLSFPFGRQEIVLFFACLLLFAACDKQGPMGPPGEPGPDGTSGGQGGGAIVYQSTGSDNFDWAQTGTSDNADIWTLAMNDKNVFTLPNSIKPLIDEGGIIIAYFQWDGGWIRLPAMPIHLDSQKYSYLYRETGGSPTVEIKARIPKGESPAYIVNLKLFVLPASKYEEIVLE